MKYLLSIVLLCNAFSSKALIIHPYLGFSITQGRQSHSVSGTGTNFIGGLRLDHQLPGGIQLGIGFDIQNLTYMDDVRFSTKTSHYMDVTAGSPAYTFYLHAGYRIRIKKFSIIPGVSIGGDYAKGQDQANNNTFYYNSSLGYVLGGNLGLEYGFKRIAIHAEFMPRYYGQTTIKDASTNIELMNYPLTIGVAIKL